LDKIRTKKTLLLAGAILASAALFIMPNSPVCGLRLECSGSWTLPSMFRWNHFVLLLAIIFRKTTYHGICHAKFFYRDWRLLRIKTTVNFTYYGVQNTAPLGIIPDSVKYSFYLGGIVFIVTVLWTVITSKEYSPKS
jgi:maltose/moltooligosaccharide transporter